MPVSTSWLIKAVPIGEEWNRCLWEWMAECDVAIILFSRAAFEASEWVRAEAAILSWRMRLQPNFKLVGVLLDDVDSAEFNEDAFFNVIRITDFQFIRDCRNQTQIVKAIQAELVGLSTETSPFEGLVVLIRELLETVNQNSLERTWKKLQCPDKPKFQPGMDVPDALARLLFRDRDNAFQQLQCLMSELAHVLDEDKACKLLKILQGVWVNPEAAATLAWVRSCGRAAAINGMEVEEFTGFSYIRRAWPYPRKHRLVKVGPSRDLEQIKKVLLESVDKIDPGSPRTLRRLKKIDDPFFLVFPPPEVGSDNPYPDQKLVAQIQQNYPNVTVLLATGHHMPDTMDYIDPVLPLLVDDQEETQSDNHFEVYDFIKNQIAGSK